MVCRCLVCSFGRACTCRGSSCHRLPPLLPPPSNASAASSGAGRCERLIPCCCCVDAGSTGVAQSAGRHSGGPRDNSQLLAVLLR